MKKTKNVSKFDLDWQIVRASVKGHQMTFYAKLNEVLDFFENNKSKENWERVANWLEGLLHGYKPKTPYTTEAFIVISDALKTFKAIDVNQLESVESTNDFSKYTFDQRRILWIDLFKRTKAWGKKGYIHQEQLEFCEQLWNAFTFDEIDMIGSYYSKENFDEIISQARTIPNTHKFLF